MGKVSFQVGKFTPIKVEKLQETSHLKFWSAIELLMPQM